MKSFRLPACALVMLSGFSASAGAAIPTGVTTAAVFETNGKNGFSMPVWFGEIPGQLKSFLVAEKNSGNIFALFPAGGGYTKQLLLNIKVRTEVEQGLLSLAFHPDFLHNRKYYVHHSAQDGARRLIVEEYEMDASFLKDSGKPPRTILEIPQPEGKSIHNGGNFTFGPDGMAYLSVGTGGDESNGQGRAELLGDILRLKIDPSNPAVPYTVPADNPFVGLDGIKPEVWAYGFRNPWRMSWDMEGNELYQGEVGQSTWEEVNVVRKGDNMGWNIMEGAHCNNCNTTTFTLPVKELDRSLANCIIGGMVFRGDKSSAFYGTYIFADHILKNLFALTQNNRTLTGFAQIGTLNSQPLAFARDALGNMYVSMTSGQIHQLLHAELKANATPTGLTPRTAGADTRNLRDGFRKQDGAYTWTSAAGDVQGWELLGLDGSRMAQGGPSAAAPLFRVHPGLYLIRLRTASGPKSGLVVLN